MLKYLSFRKPHKLLPLSYIVPRLQIQQQYRSIHYKMATPSSTPSNLSRKLSIDANDLPDSKRNKTTDSLEETRSFLEKNPLSSSLSLTQKKIWKPIIWIDCEMTGLDIKNDNIIEICCIITDGNLKIIDGEGYESTVYVPKEKLDSMNEWCINQHNKSGLVDKILSNPQQTLSKVQDELFTYIKKYIDEPRKGILAGNSVHMDKFFMMKEFPEVIDYLHYRLIDVSTVMEIGWRHNGDLMKCFPKKNGSHTAKSDILESIEQLRWYKNNYLKSTKECESFIKTEQEKLKQEAADKEAADKKIAQSVDNQPLADKEIRLEHELKDQK